MSSRKQRANLKPKRSEVDVLRELTSGTQKFIGSYEIDKTIGTFGKVKLARHCLTGISVAIKIVDRIQAPVVIREIETWRRLRHPNIAQLYEVILSESKIFMVTEYANGGEIFDYLVSQGSIKEKEAKLLFIQIVDAVQYCHKKSFVHRDLKLENILLDNKNSIKLIDFGFTREIEQNKLMETYCGSIAYAAPEIIIQEKYLGPAVDVWSLGIILFTILTGSLPFDDENEAILQKKILSLDYTFPPMISDTAKDLISSILKINPTDRLSISSIIQHEWLKDIPKPPFTQEQPIDNGLISNLADLGFDADAILKAVASDAVNQNAALYYILKTKAKIMTPLVEKVPEEQSDVVVEKKFTRPHSAPIGSRLRQLNVNLPTGNIGLASPGPNKLEMDKTDMKTAKIHNTAISEEDESESEITPTVPDIVITVPESLVKNVHDSMVYRIEHLSDEDIGKASGNETFTYTFDSSEFLQRSYSDSTVIYNPVDTKDKEATTSTLQYLTSKLPSFLSLLTRQPTIEKGIEEKPVASGSNSKLTEKSRRHSLESAPLEKDDGQRLLGKERLRKVKGIFNCTTTSMKTPAEIADQVKSALEKHSIKYKQKNYQFLAVAIFSNFKGSSISLKHVKQTAVKFEIEICSIDNTGLTGLRFKRVGGPQWYYKQLCETLLATVTL